MTDVIQALTQEQVEGILCGGESDEQFFDGGSYTNQIVIHPEFGRILLTVPASGVASYVQL